MRKVYNGQRESIFEEVKKMNEELKGYDKGPTKVHLDIYAMKMIALALVGIGEELRRTNKHLEKIAMDLEIERGEENNHLVDVSDCIQ